MAALPSSLKSLKLSNVMTANFPQLPELQRLRLRTVHLSKNALAGLNDMLTSSKRLVRLDLPSSMLSAAQLEAILYVLPRWLGRQERQCFVGLGMNESCEPFIAAAMTKTHKTQPVECLLGGVGPTLDFVDTQRRLVIALGTTSRMKVKFVTMPRPNDETNLQAYATAHQMQYSVGYYRSPLNSPWMAIASAHCTYIPKITR
ncbi:hypothetical protein SDRG_02210 [Saprolegnia diclina VS20]|uniref:Uncharacterized protein n=1 Tax=Saprolegnia diclina (strain VS20) TaxID=1156394 RepID=T0S582_SAPDV|nr:hypothetical protein SDRG_02210 [Saprolegnia diclina VS20]EQC40308.1 hypothetical protein SDRG_02210 [Saprolegnia diclina VS20]|eukprot:XP_008606007.1 hypothetical protein SDRG_02210 [Saprolegnia diclina VS20]